MEFEQYRQGVVDEEHLRLLPVLYWVSGGVTALVSLYFLIYVAIGLVFIAAPSGGGSSAPPAEFGWIFGGIGMVGFLIVGTIAVLKILAGFWIRSRRHRTACLVIAAISCLEIPYGTLLGVLSFMVLLRPSVAASFVAGSGHPKGSSEFSPTPPDAPHSGSSVI